MLLSAATELLDPFDPNSWVEDAHEFRIYGDDRATIWAIVDEIDYHWAIRWRWCLKHARVKNGPPKLYLRRAVGENAGGLRLRTYTLYLHVEIMKRTGIAPPSDIHSLVDHRSGKSLDCRRSNLRWATHTMNSKNINGKYGYDLIEG